MRLLENPTAMCITARSHLYTLHSWLHTPVKPTYTHTRRVKGTQTHTNRDIKSAIIAGLNFGRQGSLSRGAPGKGGEAYRMNVALAA